jgi:hypothetical protein
LCKYWALVEKGIRNKIDTRRQSTKLCNQLAEEMQKEILSIADYHHPNKTRLESRRQLKLRHRGLLSLKQVRKTEGNLKAAEIIRKIVRLELHNDDLAIVRALRTQKDQLLYLSMNNILNNGKA